MEYKVLLGKLETYATKQLVVFTYEDFASAEFKRADKLLAGELSAIIKAKEFEGKALTTLSLRTPSQPFRKLLVVGLGKRRDVTLETMRRAAGTAARAAREQATEMVLPFADAKSKGLAEAVQAIVEGISLGSYRFLRYKTQNLELFKELSRCTILIETAGQRKAAEAGLARGLALATAANYARDLVSTPPADMNPATLELAARELAKKHALKIQVFDEKELVRRKMGAIVAVGKGSAIKPRMLVLEYQRPGAKRHLVFCGKGVCFDSGGYNIKTMMMELMKDDMGGAASLLGMLDALATLKVKTHVTVVIGAVENLVSGEAYKPGDIVTACNGKTIEILNTDAEGRVVLADCLAYASTLKADSIIDIATLTGAAMIAFGSLAGAVLTPSDRLAQQLVAAGEETGERCWRMPMWDDYKEDVRSDIADVKNIGYSRQAGIMAGAVLLQEFVAEPSKWAHIDMGGAVNEERDRPCCPKGATGWGVRSLTRFVEKQ